ncbi:MAG: hypothetical protein PSX37_08765 [bacterium]|nr:hypothetical protein [bacterium]
MKHRHLLLIVTALTLLYAYVIMRSAWFIDNFLPTYGADDIYGMTYFAIATLAAWVVLEVAANREKSRGLVCDCGYALRGIKCPECGEPIGADHRPAPPTQKE